MNSSLTLTRVLAGAAAALFALAPLTARAESRYQHHQDAQKKASSVQNNKNTMRNLAIAGAAVAGYGLIKHNTAATVIGAAGAGLAGSQYENARKEQSQNSSARSHRHYYRRNH